MFSMASTCAYIHVCSSGACIVMMGSQCMYDLVHKTSVCVCVCVCVHVIIICCMCTSCSSGRRRGVGVRPWWWAQPLRWTHLPWSYCSCSRDYCSPTCTPSARKTKVMKCAWCVWIIGRERADVINSESNNIVRYLWSHPTIFMMSCLISLTNLLDLLLDTSIVHDGLHKITVKVSWCS